jgi:hypothetical protein
MTTVKYFHPAMGGAPVVNNSWGDLTNLLDACLVNGFNLRSPSGVTREGQTVTITYATAHGYETNQVIEVAGADQPGYNGQHRVTFTTAQSLQFVLPQDVAPVTPATGTISTKAAALGFQTVFTGANKRVYRSPNILGSRPFIRVDDSLPNGYTTTWAKFARVTIAEAMSDIDTFLPGGRAPFNPDNTNQNELGNGVTGTGGAYGWYKWYYATAYSNNGNSISESSGDGGSVVKQWFLIGDDRGFYLLTPPRNNYDCRFLYAAGEFTSYKVGDQYNSLLWATDRYVTAASTQQYWQDSGGRATLFDYAGHVCMKAWHQTGYPIRLAMMSLVPAAVQYNLGNVGGGTFPNGPDMSLIAHPIYLREENPYNVRGVLPGAYFVLHDNPYAHREVLDNVLGIPGRKMIYVTAGGTGITYGNNAGILLDLSGPWR